MLVATFKVAQAMGLPMGSMEDMENDKLFLTSKGLILEERKQDMFIPREHDRRNSGERRAC